MALNFFTEALRPYIGAARPYIRDTPLDESETIATRIPHPAFEVTRQAIYGSLVTFSFPPLFNKTKQKTINETSIFTMIDWCGRRLDSSRFPDVSCSVER